MTTLLLPPKYVKDPTVRDRYITLLREAGFDPERLDASVPDAQSVLSARADTTMLTLLEIKHLPGQHDQSTHGHGGGGKDEEESQGGAGRTGRTAYTHHDYKNVKEAQTALSAAFPRVKFDFEGMNVKAVNGISKGMADVQEQLPMIFGNTVKGVVSSDSLPYDMRQVMTERGNLAESGYFGTIVFNSKFTNIPDMEDKFRYSEMSGFHPAGTCTWEGTMVHELGHQFWDWATIDSHDALVSGEARHWRRDHDGDKTVSGYGKKNQDELWAETFRAALTPGSKARNNPTVKDLRTFIDSVSKESWRYEE